MRISDWSSDVCSSDLMFQMGGIGPIFGQVGFFHKFGGREYEDKRPLERYANESKRVLGVLESRLEGRQWLMGDDSPIADIATLGWVRNLTGFYDTGRHDHYDTLKHGPACLDRAPARPAGQGGLERPQSAQ